MAGGRGMKTAIKRSVKRAAMVPGRLWHCCGSRILTYHSVGTRNHEMNVTPEMFARQMDWLAERPDVGSLPDAAGGKGIAITFDDGYRDNLLNAAPVLRDCGLGATCFIVPGRMGGVLAHDRGQAQSDPDSCVLMTWEEAASWREMGFEIGAHTMSHRRLSKCTAREQHEEIADCAMAIQRHLGVCPEAFAYPFGSSADYDDISVRLAQEAGFAYAVSSRYGVNGAARERWALRRIWIDATDDMAMFRAKVEGRLDSLALLDSGWGVRGRRLLNRLLKTS